MAKSDQPRHESMGKGGGEAKISEFDLKSTQNGRENKNNNNK